MTGVGMLSNKFFPIYKYITHNLVQKMPCRPTTDIPVKYERSNTDFE